MIWFLAGTINGFICAFLFLMALWALDEARRERRLEADARLRALNNEPARFIDPDTIVPTDPDELTHDDFHRFWNNEQ